MLGPPCPLCRLSPNPGGTCSGASALGGADAMCVPAPRTGMCSPNAAARSVEADGALPPFSAFSWGYKIGGAGGWLSAVLDFREIPGPLGSQDSLLHPTSKLTCPHCKWAKSTLLDSLWIYPTMVESKTHQRPPSDDQSFLSAGKSILIHSNQSKTSLFGDSGLPLVSKGATDGSGIPGR